MNSIKNIIDQDDLKDLILKENEENKENNEN